MTLYLYQTGTGTPVLTLEQVRSYTAEQVVLEDGTVYSPLAEGYELSATEDCAGTLRADWRQGNPSQEERLEDVEALLAEILFGGESV